MERRSQNGRSKADSGQGSSGRGALLADGFGKPGVFGEWISVSKRYGPPVDCPLMIKPASMDGGKVGTAGEGTLCCFGVDDILLKEPFDDASCVSGTTTVKFLFRRLDDEKFFLSPVAALLPTRAGDPGTDGTLLSLSAEVTRVSAEAVDEIGSVVSDPGNGDDPLRLFDNAAEGGTGLNVALGRSCWGSGVESADFGGSATTGGDKI